MSQQESVQYALRYVIDPELGINIVDLGLVYGVEVAEEVATVRMTLTTRGCPLHHTIAASVEETVRYFCEEIKQVNIDLVWEPAWHPNRMSRSARQLMGWEN